MEQLDEGGPSARLFRDNTGHHVIVAGDSLRDNGAAKV